MTQPPKGQIRSPMVGTSPGSPVPSGAKRQLVAPQANPQADLGALAFGVEANEATRLGTVMFDASRVRNRAFGKIFGVITATSVVLAFALLPGLRKMAVKAFKSSKDAVVSIRYQGKKGKKPAEAAATDEGESEGDDSSVEAPVSDDRGDPERRPRSKRAASAQAVVLSADCKALRQAANGGAKLPVAQRVRLADCFLLIDDPAGAELALEPLKAQLDRATEAEINGQKAAETLADAQQTLITSVLRQGRARDATRLVKNRCQRWAQNNACVARAMVAVAQREFPASAARTMFGARGVKLDGKAQARLWLAGASLALAEGKPQTADQRYLLALGAAPRDAVALRKHIYETQAIDLYGRGEALKMKNLVVEAAADLKDVEAGPKLKLKLLQELMTTGDRVKTVRSLLAREDVVIRARSDFELIEILGPEALKAHQEEPFIALLRKTSERAGNGKGGMQGLSMWEARALVSAERFDKAHEALQVYEQAYGVDTFSRHMRGINYMMQDGAPRMQTLAATEFQEAFRLRKNWESLAALGMALARSGKTQQVPALLKDLERFVVTKGQRYWADMLKAEYYVAKEMYVAAIVILNRWVKSEPGFVTPHRLRILAFQRMGKKADADKEQLELDELARAARYAASREGFSSPIGLMALANRPID